MISIGFAGATNGGGSGVVGLIDPNKQKKQISTQTKTIHMYKGTEGN